MRLPEPLVPARFLRRLNRFAGEVVVDSRVERVHIANSGRMQELLQEGRPVLLVPRRGGNRHTAYDLALVRLPSGWASADARLPSRLVEEALEEGRLPPFRGLRVARREVAVDSVRLDLYLEGEQGPCFLEVKSVTLVEGGTGLFPDAPTERGRRHLSALVRLRGQGHRCAMVFVVQRSDAERFAPHDGADPAFGRAFRSALAQGVEAHAYRCRVDPPCIRLQDPIPVVV